MGLAAFVVQSAFTVSMLFGLSTDVLDSSARLYAGDTMIPGASAAARIAVIDGRTGRVSRERHVVEVEASPMGEVGEVKAYDGAFSAAHLLEAPDASFRWVVRAPGDDGEIREFASRDVVAATTSWLHATETFRPTHTARTSSRNVATNYPAGVWQKAGGASDCAMRVQIAVSGGALVRGMHNTVLVRVVDAAGFPAADTLVSLRRGGQEGVTKSERTDGLGIAAFDVQPAEVEAWAVGFRCGDVDASFEFEAVATWDGATVRPSAPVIRATDPIAFGVAHERSWGQWHQDVVCDGAWLATSTVDVIQGVSFQTFPDLRLPSRPGLTLCSYQGAPYQLSPDPPRATAYFLLVPEDVEVRRAVRELATLGAQHARGALQDQLRSGTLEALEGATDRELEVFARWLLDSLSPRFIPIPLLTDDSIVASRAHEEQKQERARVLTRMLIVDVVVVLASTLSIVAYGAARARRRTQVLIDEDNEAGLDLLDGNVRLWIVVGGAAVIAAALFSIVALARLL